MRQALLGLLSLAVVLLVPPAAVAAEAQTAPANTAPANQMPTIKVATRIIEPFVQRVGDKLSGFSIELWDKIAERIGVHTDYDVRTTLPDLLGAVKAGGDDAAIAAISITAQRERDFDFSHPMFDAGLGILAREGDSETSISEMLLVWSKQMLPALGIGVLLVLIGAHLIWLFERRRESGIPMSRSYFSGVLLASYWIATLMGNQADNMPQRAVSRIITVIWMYIGLVFVAYFTAFATTALTVRQLKSGITGPSDLVGKRVATVEGSTAAKYLMRSGIDPITFPTVAPAIQALIDHKTQAVVYDSPILHHFAASEAGRGVVRVAGPTFLEEKYGIMFPQNSALRKPVNEALLRLREEGVYQELQRKWFGAEEAQ